MRSIDKAVCRKANHQGQEITAFHLLYVQEVLSLSQVHNRAQPSLTNKRNLPLAAKYQLHASTLQKHFEFVILKEVLHIIILRAVARINF